MHKFILCILFFFGLSLHLFAQDKSDKLLDKIEAAEKKGDYAAVVNYSSELIKLYPDNSTPYLIRGKAYTKLRENDLATKDLDKALKLNADCETYYYRSYCFSLMGKSDKAIADANKALQLCGDTSDYALSTYINRGTAKLHKRDFNGAYDDYILAYAIDTNHFETIFALGSLCDEIGKDSIALAYLNRAYQIDSTNSDLINNMGFFFLDREEYEKAARYMNRALQLDKENPLAWNNLGYCKYKLGDYNGAMSDINHSMKLYPTNSYAWRNRALVYVALNNKAAACSDMEKALSLGYSTQYGYDVQELYNKNCK